MRKIIFFVFILLFLTQLSYGQCIQDSEFNDAIPKRDLRGVFLTTIYNLDWPSSRTATPAVQQAELTTILDNLKTKGYNTVFLQVRPECDALYNSSLEPWSYRLTGTQGLAPNPLWDPLDFAIIEAHNRGLDLHAWLNPYRVRAKTTEYVAAPTSILNTQPSWILTASNNVDLKILNPGLPEVRDYIKTIVEDISNRYDIDGIHFDDYFYPNSGMTTNQDNPTYINNNPTNIPTIEDWRRNNVNLMIAKVYDAIQVINTNQNKNIVFGVSPSGIWKSGTPTGIVGNPSFSALYCDPIAWLDSGKVDYLAPQLYWKITGSQDYIALSKWWNDQVKSRNKQLYLSQGYYKMTDANNWAATEITNQIIQNRATTMDVAFGQIAYNYTSIKDNAKGINDLLSATQFKYKSFPKPIAGKDVICPNFPINIRSEGLSIKWDTPSVASDGDLPVKYVVYAFDDVNQALTNKEDGSKIVDILSGNQLVVSQTLLETKHFVVSSLDKNNNENGNFQQTLDVRNHYLAENNFITIYSNPFSDEFVIENKLGFPEKFDVRLFDLSGKLVWQKDSNDNFDNKKIVVRPDELKSGFYIGILLYPNGSNKSFKIIKR
jgi:uncharacterized lipoprotein YddW (UPF0748 family)